MKTTISCLILTFLFTGISAQEISTTNHNSHTQNTELKPISKNTATDISIIKETNTIDKDICYSELSKKTFYEALIRQNGLKIDLNTNEDKLAIKTTEDMINSKKSRISYSK